MQTEKRLNRREFCTAAMGLVTMAAIASPAPGQAEQTASRIPRAEPTRVRRVLDGMESKIGRYWSTPRSDAEYLSLMEEATRQSRVLEVGTPQGY